MGQILEDRFLRAGAARGDRRRAARSSTAPARAVVGQAAGPGAAVVTLADGATLSGSLLVGCDGRGSGVAARAGIGRRGWDYGQTSLVCAVAHERPHRGVAHQFFMPAGPLAILPLPGDRSSIVWTERRDRARGDRALDAAGYLAELRPRFGDFLGEIALEGERYAYPLGLSLAERWTRRGWRSAGDAAHGIHPLAGQGLNLGLRDVAALAEVLVEARRRGEDVGAADVLGALRALAAARHRAAGGGDRRAQPAVLERQPAAAPRPRPRARAGQPPAGAAPRADPRGGGDRRRPAAAAARPPALGAALGRIWAGQAGTVA